MSVDNNDTIIKELLDIMDEEGIKYSPVTMKKVIDYAKKIYTDTKRYKGETTFCHAINVAKIVATLKIGIEAVYAAVLHETPKYEAYKYVDIETICGSEVATLVKDASKLYLLNYDGQKEMQAENLRKMFMAIAKDIRVVIIKLADRLYNMRNIYEEPLEFQIKKAEETMEVYAPIAHRLGLSIMKSEMEDISFSILKPEEYEKIRKAVELKKSEREKYINERIEEIKGFLEKENIEATIYGRAKYYYSIYKKTKMNNCKVEDLFDLYAIRVIVNSIKDCYTVLGIVHENYKPMPGRFKDYIAVPKTNMYQSLHTTLFGDKKAPFEIQIRTWDMHKIAEYGVAAHFLYKEGKSKMTESDELLSWLRKTIEFEQVAGGTTTYNDIKIELFGDEVFVFTPKGEIVSLPKGSSVIDFAYAIHQQIGERMVGAKVNEKMVPIHTKLKNSDIVEIVTSKVAQGPKADWLNYVKTSTAKNRIVAYLKKQNKDDNVIKGKELLEKELNEVDVDKTIALSEKFLKEILEQMNLKSPDELFEAIGFRVSSSRKIANKIIEKYNKENNLQVDKIEPIKKKLSNKNSSAGVVVKGIDNCLVKFAKCCSPLPGDDIVGYITYGKGVSIHRSDCSNLVGLDLEERKIDVKWKETKDANYESKIIVRANDRSGISMEILKALQDDKINVQSFTAKVNDIKECIIELSVMIHSSDELSKILKLIKKVDSVFDVKRLK